MPSLSDTQAFFRDAVAGGFNGHLDGIPDRWIKGPPI
jgi:hypothetical protein